MPFLIALYTCLLSHLTLSKDYEEGKKVIAYCVFVVIAGAYVFTRVIF